MRWRTWMMLAGGAAAGWFVAQSTHAAKAAAPASFERMDADHDGRITRAEHAAAAAGMFRTMDRNGDGKVSAAEMEDAQARINGRPPAAGDLPARDKIRAVDGNGDGVLTAAEHAAASDRMFGMMDGDVDGRLDPIEFRHGHAGLKGQGGNRKPSTTTR